MVALLGVVGFSPGNGLANAGRLLKRLDHSWAIPGIWFSTARYFPGGSPGLKLLLWNYFREIPGKFPGNFAIGKSGNVPGGSP